MPDGFGAMGQEAVVRSIITASLTGAMDVQLEDPVKRDKLRAAIGERIGKESDVKAEDLVFTDLTVK